MVGDRIGSGGSSYDISRHFKSALVNIIRTCLFSEGWGLKFS